MLDITGTFAGAGDAAGARAMTCVFQEYLVPMAFTAEQFALHAAANSISLEHSPLWRDEDGNVAAAALLGVRGRRGWIGGFGIAPAHRGCGAGTRLVDRLIRTARGLGLESLRLEVLEANAPAIALYERAGFTRTRSLHSLTARSGGGLPSGFSYADARALANCAQDVPPCWQRELPLSSAQTAIALDAGTYAIFRSGGEGAQIFSIAASTPETMTALTQALAEGRPNRRLLLLNEPDGSRMLELAACAGWSTALVQHEMALPL